MSENPSEPVRVLITGSREFSSRPIIAAALTAVSREYPGRLLVVIHGQARGADKLSGAIARSFPGRLVEEPYPVPSWKHPDGTFNAAAGHQRNQVMVDSGATVCLAFLAKGAENKGTRGCMSKAKRAGIPVREHWN